MNKADQVISWSDPTAIIYGARLSDAQLNATLTTGNGALSYDPTVGTLLDAGTHTLKVTAAATDNYNKAVETVSLTVDKAPQTISFSELANKTYGDADFSLAASAPAGAVSFTVKGPATLSGSTLHLTGAGTVTVTATQAGNSNYTAADEVERSFAVAKGTQTISWTTPAAITYGTKLSTTQLNATLAGVVNGAPAGALTYEPVAGTLLDAGTYTLTVNAAQTDNYNAAVKTVTLIVDKANQIISWTAPTPITYGAKLSDAQLNATVAGVDEGSAVGALTYDPEVGTLLDAGTRTLTVTAAATGNYNKAVKTVSLTVNKADQVISWNDPTAITYGTKLSDVQLNASLTTGNGVLSYDPAIGTLLDAGTRTLKVTAAATDNYNKAEKTVNLTVNQAPQTISFSEVTDKTYGDADFNLTATAPAGTVSFSVAGPATLSGSTLHLTGAGTVTVTASQAGTANYQAAEAVVRSFAVAKGTQTISWSDPAAITYGTKLSTIQLNATVSGVNGGASTGTLSYDPAASTLLNVGKYTLTVTAAETPNYNQAVKTVSLMVNKADQLISWSAPAAITYGTKLSDAQLNATVAGVSGGSAPGALTYTPGTGTVLDAGTRVLSVTAAATDNYKEAVATVSLTVNKQTINPLADTYYTGSSFYWTTSSASNTTTLNLVSTLKTNSNYDGDIRTARVSFFIRTGTGTSATLTPINGAQNLPVGLVDPSDLTTGTAATNVQYSISGSTTILNIAVVVSGNYKSVNDQSTDKPVTVAVPTPGGQIVGGGKFSNEGSSGYIKGSSNFAFYVQYNKSLKNPQGGAEITVYSKYDRNGNLTDVPHTYQLKSNAISVLATKNPTAQFSSKANISEIVDGVAQSLEGNCTMQLEMYDGKDNPTVATDQVDRLAITVYRSNGGIWYSSKWNETKTVLRDLEGPKDVVCVTGTSSTTTPITAVSVSSIVSTDPNTLLVKDASNLLEVYPMPLVDRGTVHFRAQKAGKVQVVVFDGLGRQVATLYDGVVGAGEEQNVEFDRKNLPNGFYFFRLLTDGKVENKRITIAN
ncbi:T9SS type A sorting domain-containing protein [Hymenobacter wooponensis]|uniref:T9SS type A sorting domain-containing protein n=1 Tax=Hymenobacter wooponensis TaxID=1525360 RepID=UPI0014369059|nr:T9SS type A sorting domain-containing protein [Hymenobacter wooponensis]